MRGNFLGSSDDRIDAAGFIKLKLNMNCLPPPHEPLFQANFARNAAELVQQVRAWQAQQPPEPTEKFWKDSDAPSSAGCAESARADGAG